MRNPLVLRVKEAGVWEQPHIVLLECGGSRRCRSVGK